MSNTESANTQWKQVAETLGFSDEPTMWFQLYVIEERKIGELAKTLGYGTATVARRIDISGVEKRKRGGSNAPSRIAINLAHLDQRMVRLTPASELAKLIGASVHSVYRLLKEM